MEMQIRIDSVWSRKYETTVEQAKMSKRNNMVRCIKIT